MFYRRSGDGKKTLKRKWKQLGMQRSNAKWRVFSTGLGVFSLAFLGTFFASSILAPMQNSGATTETATAGGYSLSLSAAPSIDLNLSVVDETDMMTVAETDVTASTTAPNGYKLYISMNDTSNALKLSGGSATIASTSGTLASPAELNSGEWGFAIPSGQISETNHFDASYVAFENGYSASQFAGIPASGTNPATLINATSTPNTTTDEFQVYYGLKAKSDTATIGTYTNSVLWTAVADSAQTAGATVSPTSASAAGGDTITVTSTLFSTSAIDANIYMLTSTAWQDVSANPSHISNYSSMQMSGCTQSSSTPVTYTGCVTPANDEGTGYHVYMDVPRYEKRYNADFTYESAEPTFWNITTMQEMTNTICSSVTAPTDSSVTTIADTKAKYDAATSGSVVPQRTLVDPRGSEPYKTYTIRKLADGRCWMVDNLALENAELNSANSNLPGNKTVSLPSSSTSLWCTSNSQACDDQLMTLSYADAGDSTSGHPEYGNYYNWYTATATYGGYDTTTDTSYSICPKGWRLPKGGSSGEFQTLYSKYNTSALMRDASGPNFILAGYRDGSSTRSASTYGYYWSSTANNNNYAYNLVLSSSNVNPAFDDLKYVGYTVRCIAENRDPASEEFFQITTMQEMTNDVCSSVVAPTSSSVSTVGDAYHYVAGSTVPTTALKDTRDNNWYTVKKLADGRCWMTDNLRLKNYTLKASDSNVTSDGFVVPNEASGTSYNTSYVFDSGSTDYGVYYSWYAATAGAGTQSQTGDTSTSVCPKGWRLPKGGSSGEFQTLYGKYNTHALMRDANGPNFILAGYRHSGSTSNAGMSGVYWSSTAFADFADYAYYLSLSGSYVTPANLDPKHLGFTVRCIADMDTMQDMTNETCDNAEIGWSKSLLDTRDNNVYTVRKLADERCWMVDNLRLKNYTLKASDSNVTSDGFVVPNEASGSSYDTSYVFDSGSTDYGVYYSWYAATAGAGTQSQTGDTSTSVCPKGWRLPKGGSSGEFQTLYGKYNTYALMRDANGPNFILAGSRSGSSTYLAGTCGYYWSSTGTAFDKYSAYDLYLDSSDVYPTYYHGKYSGNTVRCIKAN